MATPWRSGGLRPLLNEWSSGLRCRRSRAFEPSTSPLREPHSSILPASWTIYHDHQRAQEQLRSGDCQVVEGTVEQFHPMPYHGHSLESFTVNVVRFDYSDFDDSKPGFNNTASRGSPIRAGMRVRVHYSGPIILQIEVP